MEWGRVEGCQGVSQTVLRMRLRASLSPPPPTHTHTPQLFTRDVDVWPHMNNVAALASASMFALGIDVVSSGVNIGMGDAKYVAQVREAREGGVRRCRREGTAARRRPRQAAFVCQLPS